MGRGGRRQGSGPKKGTKYKKLNRGRDSEYDVFNKFLRVLNNTTLGIESLAFFQWFYANPKKREEYQIFKNYMKITVISDDYCRELLASSGVDNPNKEIIELKRQQIIAKRINKQIKERIQHESNNADVYGKQQQDETYNQRAV